MSRTLEEKETIIRYDETDSYAYIYTHNRALQTRLIRLKATKEGVNYRIPKSYVLIRRPRQVSEASREKLSARMKLLQANLRQKEGI